MQDAQQTEENAQRVRDVIFMTAVFALNDPSLIDEAVQLTCSSDIHLYHMFTSLLFSYRLSVV